MATNLEAAAVMAAQVGAVLVLRHLMLLLTQEMLLNHNNQVFQEMTVMETLVEETVLKEVLYLTLLLVVEALVAQPQTQDQVVVTMVQVMVVQVKMYLQYLVLHNLGIYQAVKQDSSAAAEAAEVMDLIPQAQLVVADQVVVVMVIMAMVLLIVQQVTLVAEAEGVQTQ